MKICWDTLENIEYNPKYGFRDKRSKNRVYLVESDNPCLNCGEYFLRHNTQKYKYCCRKCSQSGKHNNMYGKKRPEHSLLMKEKNPMEFISKTGKDNPNWKGGVSKNKYCSGWSVLSKEIRDFYEICQNPSCCGTSDRLTSHHIDYNKKHCHPSNLICLCHICNAKANGDRKYHENFYRGLKENENHSP